jgi:hypothetical protein
MVIFNQANEYNLRICLGRPRLFKENSFEF